MDLTAKPRNQTASYRQRGYVCTACSHHQLVFGSDTAPSSCTACDAIDSIELEWDHRVTTATRVVDLKKPCTG